MERGGSYHKRVLRPLFFGTLNTPVLVRAPAARAFGAVPFLNGGLFAPAPLERRWPKLQLTDASLGRAFGEQLCDESLRRDPLVEIGDKLCRAGDNIVPA